MGCQMRDDSGLDRDRKLGHQLPPLLCLLAAQTIPGF